jgi:hypothetical protein
MAFTCARAPAARQGTIRHRAPHRFAVDHELLDPVVQGGLAAERDRHRGLVGRPECLIVLEAVSVGLFLL